MSIITHRSNDKEDNECTFFYTCLVVLTIYDQLPNASVKQEVKRLIIPSGIYKKIVLMEVSH